MNDEEYRFEIAISFAGDNKRNLVRDVAKLLQEKVGKGKVFFDEWFESELAGPDAQVVLQNYYRKKTRLVVTCVCQRYNEKPWTQEEWRAIQAFERDLRDAGTDNVKRMRFLPLRFGDGEIDGLFSTAIVPDVRNRTPEKIAELILKRLKLAREESARPTALNPNAATPAESPDTEDILALEEKVKNIRVDRDEEKQRFRDIVTKQSPVRVLLIEAESGMGKSVLIQDFLKTEACFRHALIDFKNASISFGDFLFKIRSQLGQNNFTMFDTICRDILQRANAPLLPTLLPSQLDGVLQRARDDDDHDQQMRQIFDALSSDLASLARTTGKPVVILIDTFEGASESLQSWIGRVLVPRISSAEDVVWIITGQHTPAVELGDANWLLRQRLKPLAPEHCREYLMQIKIEWEEVLIKYIAKVSDGKPKKLQALAKAAIRM